MMKVQDGSPRSRLRDATGTAHARVDACFPLGLADSGAYRRYLLGMHALVAAVEDALAAAPLAARWRAWCRPQRVRWLCEDLADIDALPMPAGPGLSVSGAAEAAGALYVLEGSALGARQLLADAAALGWDGGRGARFLCNHGGRDAGRRWRAYVDCLEQARFEAEEEQAMCDAAARAFACAEHEFLRAARLDGTDG